MRRVSSTHCDEIPHIKEARARVSVLCSKRVLRSLDLTDYDQGKNARLEK